MKGGAGAINLASTVVEACGEISNFKYLYPLSESIEVAVLSVVLR